LSRAPVALRSWTERNAITPHIGTRVLADRLRRNARAFSDAVSSVETQLWDLQVSPKLWSVSQCSEHVVLTEEWLHHEIIPAILATEPHRASRCECGQWADEDALYEHVTTRHLGVTTPQNLRPTGRFRSPEAVLERFAGVRQRSIDLAEHLDPADARQIRHVVLGLLDTRRWLVFAVAHTDLHIAQILDVIAVGRTGGAARAGKDEPGASRGS